MNNPNKFGIIAVNLLLIFCYLGKCVSAFEEIDMEPMSNPLEYISGALGNLLKPDIDRIFFQQIDPTKPDGFFGLSMKWRLTMPVQSFTEFPLTLLQFAYPIKLPFNIYYDVVERRDSEENEIRRKREAREIREERLTFFRTLERIIKNLNLPGQACILRTICEVAETPFAENFFGESLNAIFGFSSVGRTEFPDEDGTFNQYVDAEHYGKSHGSCHKMYSECPASLFDLLPAGSHKIEDV